MAVDRGAVAVVVEGDRVEVYPRVGKQPEFVEAAKAATGAGPVRTTSAGRSVGLVMSISTAREAGLVAKPRARKTKARSAETNKKEKN